MLAKFFKQGMHYASGTLLLSIASLVSFPILTRLLPVDQYGMLSLLTTISGLFVAFYKFGLQQSVVRYYRGSDDQFNSAVLLSFLVSITISSIFVFILYAILDFDILDDYFYFLLLISIFQSIRSVIISTYAASEKTVFVNLINVTYKYSSLLLMLIFIFFYEKSAISVLISLVLADGIFAIALAVKWRKTFDWSRPKFNDIKTLFLYGSPLMLAEIVQMSHAFVDRFLIEYYFGLELVAAYVAPYSMSKIISDIVFGGLAVAVVPIYMAMWNRKEYKQTSELLSKISDYYLLIFPISVGGLYLVSEPLMSIAASDKYVDTAYIMPIVFVGVGIFSSTFIYSSGLRIKKNQTKILQYVTESLVVNVILNIIFLKEYGIIASAWATVASYFWMSFRFYIASKSIINIHFNWKNLLTGLVIGLALIFITPVIPNINLVVIDLLFRIFIGSSMAVILLLIMSNQARHDMKSVYGVFVKKIKSYR